jgi:hypothetical protein
MRFSVATATSLAITAPLNFTLTAENALAVTSGAGTR